MGRHLSLSIPCCEAQAPSLLSGNLGKATQWGEEESKASNGVGTWVSVHLWLKSEAREAPGSSCPGWEPPLVTLARSGVQAKSDGPGPGPDLMEGW